MLNYCSSDRGCVNIQHCRIAKYVLSYSIRSWNWIVPICKLGSCFECFTLWTVRDKTKLKEKCDACYTGCVKINKKLYRTRWRRSRNKNICVKSQHSAVGGIWNYLRMLRLCVLLELNINTIYCTIIWYHTDTRYTEAIPSRKTGHVSGSAVAAGTVHF